MRNRAEQGAAVEWMRLGSTVSRPFFAGVELKPSTRVVSATPPSLHFLRAPKYSSRAFPLQEWVRSFLSFCGSRGRVASISVLPGKLDPSEAMALPRGLQSSGPSGACLQRLVPVLVFSVLALSLCEAKTFSVPVPEETGASREAGDGPQRTRPGNRVSSLLSFLKLSAPAEPVS